MMEKNPPSSSGSLVYLMQKGIEPEAEGCHPSGVFNYAGRDRTRSLVRGKGAREHACEDSVVALKTRHKSGQVAGNR